MCASVCVCVHIYVCLCVHIYVCLCRQVCFCKIQNIKSEMENFKHLHRNMCALMNKPLFKIIAVQFTFKGFQYHIPTWS